MKKGMWAGKILLMIVIFIGVAIGFGMATMYLWNWLVPALFAGPVITFWQAIGLLALSKLLFWGFGKGGHHKGGHWRPYWKEKWGAMSTEDRERFRQKMKDKWCGHKPDASGEKPGISTD